MGNDNRVASVHARKVARQGGAATHWRGCVMYKNIVVGTDCSTTANRAVSKAADIAKLTGAKLHIVCAYREPIPLVAAEAPAFLPRSIIME